MHPLGAIDRCSHVRGPCVLNCKENVGPEISLSTSRTYHTKRHNAIPDDPRVPDPWYYAIMSIRTPHAPNTCKNSFSAAPGNVNSERSGFTHRSLGVRTLRDL